jgi:predicted phosphodiesterase
VRLLILSDIHANLEALEACLEAAPPYDYVINLGDIVGYGASPNEVTAISRQLCRVFVRGNHDKAATGAMDLDSFNPIAAMAALWTRETLEEDNLEWLRDLPQGPLEVEGLGDVLLVHGSPLDEDEYIIVQRDAIQPLMASQHKLTLFGHTHIQGGFSVVGQKWETLRPAYRHKRESDNFEYALDPKGKYLINPGSVGQPRDGDSRAAFLLLNTQRWSVTYYRVPYDLDAAQQRILEAGLPDRLATRLADGR